MRCYDFSLLMAFFLLLFLISANFTVKKLYNKQASKKTDKMSHKKLVLTIFAISFSLLMLADDTLACSCLPSHPQTSYCNAEYGMYE